MHGSAASEFATELAVHFERGGVPAAAAAQLAIAGARALARGAGREALHAARHALQLGQSSIDRSLEFELRVLEAVALTRLHVVSEPEVAAAFERARAVGAVDSPAWPRALHGSWWVHFTRGELASARSLAEEVLALAERRGDPELRLTGLNAMGFTLMMMGDLADARTHLDAALEAHEALAGTLPLTPFVQDPGVEASSALALVAWLVGEPRRARQLSERAAALAVANRHPLSEVSALWVAAMQHALAGEFETVHELTERLYGVIRDQEVPEDRSGFAWLHGRALVALGRVDEGLVEMRSAMHTTLAVGMRFGLCEFHHYYAQACRAAGEEAEARASIDAGLALAVEGGERMMLSPLLQQLAEVQADRGDTAASAETFARAIETARTQGAVFHELVALASAQRLGCEAADAARLRQLLRLYADDASPVIAAARSLID
jgi:tetratricopeptide (TPR) repeat protein